MAPSCAKELKKSRKIKKKKKKIKRLVESTVNFQSEWASVGSEVEERSKSDFPEALSPLCFVGENEHRKIKEKSSR